MLTEPYREIPRSNIGNGAWSRGIVETVSQPHGGVSTTRYQTYGLPAYQPHGGSDAAWVSPVQSITTIQNTRTEPGGFLGTVRQPDITSHVTMLRVNMPQASSGNNQVAELVARQMREAFPGGEVLLDHQGVFVSQHYSGNVPPHDDVLAPKAIGTLLRDMERADLIAKEPTSAVARAMGAGNHVHFSNRFGGNAPSFSARLHELRVAQGGAKGMHDFAVAPMPDMQYPTIELMAPDRHMQHLLHGDAGAQTPSQMREQLFTSRDARLSYRVEPPPSYVQRSDGGSETGHKR